MEAVATLLARLHAWVATAAALLAGLVVLVGALDGVRAGAARAWLDRLGGALVVTLTVAALLGPGIMVGLGGPASPLHVPVAVVALAAVPAARVVAARRGSARMGWWMAAGGLLTLAALPLLWTTGG